MAFAHKVDWGRLSCIPLRVTQEPPQDIVSDNCGWSSEGEATLKSRVTILERARKKNITLKKLCDELDVKWCHFKDWGDLYGIVPIEIFLNHLPWKDELLHKTNGFLRQRLGVEYDT